VAKSSIHCFVVVWCSW